MVFGELMVKVILSGGLGNNLFQYFYGRLIAEMQGDSLSLAENAHHLPELTALRPLQPQKDIVIDGFFQQQQIFREHRIRLRAWLDAYLPAARKPEPNSMVLHIRTGDLYQHWRPHSTVHPHHVPCYYFYYKKMLRDHPGRKVYAVCERTDDPVLLKLQQNFTLEVISGTVLEDFYFLLHADVLVLSVSTFAWWAAFLSDARIKHYPLLGYFNPDIRPDIDLVVRDPRYVYHTLPQIQEWQSTPGQIDQILNG